MPEKRRPSGGTQLSLYRSAIDRHILEDIGGGGRWHRQDTMGTMNLPAACMDGRGNHLFRGQPLHQQAHRCNIRNGIHSSYFVEVDF